MESHMDWNVELQAKDTCLFSLCGDILHAISYSVLLALTAASSHQVRLPS